MILLVVLFFIYKKRRKTTINLLSLLLTYLELIVIINFNRDVVTISSDDSINSERTPMKLNRTQIENLRTLNALLSTLA